MANVNLILLDDVENLGLAGDEVHVAPGYARNYLLPRGLAAKATSAALRLVEARKAEIESRRAKALGDAQALAAKLGAVTLSVVMQATEDGQLFGSVSPRMVAEQLREQGFDIDHTRVKIDTQIKSLGEFEAEVKLHQDVSAKVKLNVVRG